MKRIAFYLTISHIAFTCGVGVSLLCKSYRRPPAKVSWAARPAVPSIPTVPSVPTNVSTPVTPRPQVVFGEGRLRIITHQVRMESDRLHYQIDVSYPEIVGSNDPHIQNLNRQMKRLVTQRYEWVLDPAEAERYDRETPPEFYNTVDLDYEVRLATDSLLSIYFNGYQYCMGAAHGVQVSFTINYDLTLRKELKLSDIFKPNSKYLAFLARYCRDGLAKGNTSLFEDAFAHPAEALESWNITKDSIIFNFDSCKVTGCSGGEQTVEIPFTALMPLLKRERGIRW